MLTLKIFQRRLPVPGLVGIFLIAFFTANAHAGPKVVLIGDDYRGVIMREVAARERYGIERHGDVYELAVESAGLTLSNLAPGASVTTLANLLHAGEIALIVVDSTKGPTPVIREHVLVARQARVPMLAVLVANVERLHAGAPDEAVDLLALEIREIRELLSAYDLDGNSVPVYYDAQTPQPGDGIDAFGALEALRALSRFTPRRARTMEMGNAREIWGAIYLLTELEADGHAVSLTPDDSVIVWSEGTQSRATLDSVTQYHPGDFREMPLSMEAPLKGREGSRILLVSGDRVVGLGAITQIGR
jgi:translation elongation factor EF-Tu-like GTPase